METMDSCDTGKVQYKKQRILVLTDITPKDREPDDYQSLIRLLLHSNQFDIEGIISTTSCWLKDKLYTDIIHGIINKYALVRDNLTKHESGFPKTDYLHSIVKEGNDGYGMADVSMEEQSEGFRHIIKVVNRQDPRPVWVLLWGGANTLAQAIFYLENTHTKDKVEKFIEKIKVYDIQGQDDAGAWICRNYPEVFWLRCYMMNKGISRRIDADLFPEAYGGNEEIVSPEWFKENIMSNHGALGGDYPMAKYKFEGDTPSFLYLISNGLNDPLKQWQGSWGGRFRKEKVKNVNGGNNKLVEEGQAKYYPYYMYNPAGDTWDYPGGVNAPYVNNIYASLFRWREAFQNEFAARMDWCIKDYDGANHPPIAIVQGELNRTVFSGQTVFLSAEGSFDPDGDEINYNWYYYKEAGNFDKDIKLSNENTCNASFKAPDVDSPAELHILLMITDTGTPPLTRYKRVIVNVKPKHNRY